MDFTSQVGEAASTPEVIILCDIIVVPVADTVGMTGVCAEDLFVSGNVITESELFGTLEPVLTVRVSLQSDDVHAPRASVPFTETENKALDPPSRVSVSSAPEFPKVQMVVAVRPAMTTVFPAERATLGRSVTVIVLVSPGAKELSEIVFVVHICTPRSSPDMLSPDAVTRGAPVAATVCTLAAIRRVAGLIRVNVNTELDPDGIVCPEGTVSVRVALA